MPVVAVAGAVFVGIEIAAVGIAALSAMQVVAAVGAIAAGVGAVTGSKELMMIGGLASLAGGIGSIASGEGLFGIGASGAAESSGGLNAVNGSDVMSDSFTALNSEGVNQAAGGFQGAGDTLASMPAAAPVDMAANPSASPGLVNNNPASSATVAPPATATPEALTLTPPSTEVTGTGLPAKTLTPNTTPEQVYIDSRSILPGGSDSLPGTTPKFGSPGEDSGGIFGAFKGFGAFAKDNKELLSMGGNFLGGFFDKSKEAQNRLYDARAANETLQGDILRQQALNANSVPNMNSLRVADKNIFPTTAPTYLAPRVGLVNSTRA